MQRALSLILCSVLIVVSIFATSASADTAEGTFQEIVYCGIQYFDLNAIDAVYDSNGGLYITPGAFYKDFLSARVAFSGGCKVYENEIRVYAGNSLTITPLTNYRIVSVTIDSTSTYSIGTALLSDDTILTNCAHNATDGSASVSFVPVDNASAITITPGVQFRAKSITITYEFIPEVVNFLDAVKNVSYSDDYALVYMDVPITSALMTWTQSGSGIVNSVKGSSMDVDCPEGGAYYLSVYPMGDCKYLDLSNLPADTSVTLGIDVYWENWGLASITETAGGIDFYWSDFCRDGFAGSNLAIEQEGRHFGTVTFGGSYTISQDDLDDYAYGQPIARLTMDVVEANMGEFSVSDMRFVMSMSAIYYKSLEDPEYADWLEDIEAQLIAQEQSLKDILAAQGVTNEKLDDLQDTVTDTNEKLDQTNNWLSNILDGITSIPEMILDGIKGLFVPDAEGLANQQEKWTQLLEDRFGAVYESVAIIDNFASAFTDQSTQTTIEFPSVTIPLAGADFVFGGWQVDVVPDGFEFLIEVLKKIIDIVCTFLFVQGMKRRLDHDVLRG